MTRIPASDLPASVVTPDDALEFELIDFASARAAHDEIPPGVGTLPPPETDWETRRRKAQPTDRALAGVTIDWTLSLPAKLRPFALCEKYPRVANALAAVWDVPQKRQALLKSLVFDRRGNRSGFPEAVRNEIEELWFQSSSASNDDW